MKISKKLYQSIKLNPLPAYRIALAASIHPNTLSKIIHGAIPIKENDSRVLKLGEVLKLNKSELFESEEKILTG